MALRTRGGHLLKRNGHLTTCCCGGYVPCCAGFADTQLYLTITDFAMNPGSTCHVNCDAPFSVTALAASSGIGPRSGAIWALNCLDDNGRLAGDLIWNCVSFAGTSQKYYRWDAIFLASPRITSGCGAGPTTYCVFSISNNITFVPESCDPFYYERVHTISFAPDIGSPFCGSATARFIITE